MKKNLKVRTVGHRCDDSGLRLRHHRASQVDGRAEAEFRGQYPSRAGPQGRQPPGTGSPGAGRRQGRRRQTMERLKDDLQEAEHHLDQHGRQRCRRPCDGRRTRSTITIKGIPATQTSAFRNLVTERYPTYMLTALNSTDYSMRLKPTDLIDLKKRHRAADHGHHRQPHRPASGWPRRPCSSTAAAPMTNPGAVAGRGRSGARQGTDRHRRGARNRRRQGRPVPQPRSPAGAARRRAAAGNQAGTNRSRAPGAKANSGTWSARSR